ncbi:ssDNA endonuclease and repair protein rad10 [Tilletia horrida]|nr:ssDNA endonuclease and repair protein rad10 [Tilletia horrida]
MTRFVGAFSDRVDSKFAEMPTCQPAGGHSKKTGTGITDKASSMASASSSRAGPSNGNNSNAGAGRPNGPRIVQPQPRAQGPRISGGQGSGNTVLVNSCQVGANDHDLRYHRLHPEYIHTRIQKLAQMYALRILLIMCDVNDHQAAIKELTKVAIVNNLTIIVAWSAEEAGRYIETYKILEHKPVDVIKERISDDYMSQLTSVLTSIRGVNKTDVTTLLSNFGSLQRIATAAPSNLMMCPGFGDVKVRRLKEAFSQPFRAGETRTRAERISAGENLVGLKETIDPTEPRREGSPDEMLEMGPGDDFDSHGGLFDMDFFDDNFGAEPEPASQQPPPKRPRIQIGDI